MREIQARCQLAWGRRPRASHGRSEKAATIKKPAKDSLAPYKRGDIVVGQGNNVRGEGGRACDAGAWGIHAI